MERAHYPIINIRSAALVFLVASFTLPILWTVLVLWGVPKVTVFWILCGITLLAGITNLFQLIRKTEGKVAHNSRLEPHIKNEPATENALLNEKIHALEKESESIIATYKELDSLDQKLQAAENELKRSKSINLNLSDVHLLERMVEIYMNELNQSDKSKAEIAAQRLAVYH